MVFFESLDLRRLFSAALDLIEDIDAHSPGPQPMHAAPAAAPVIYPNKFVPVADAPRPRFSGYNFVLHGKLWSAGGFDSQFRTVAGADVYNPNTNQWTSMPGMRLKAAETHAGVAIDGKFVYLAGGYVGDLLSGQRQPVSDTVWQWEPVANKWTRIASLPEGIGGGALVKVGRELHFFGGTTKDRVTNSGKHWMLDLGPTTSAKDDGTHWTQKRSLPKARDHLSGVGLDGKVYAVGGEFGHDVKSIQTGYVHRFDPATNQWTQRRSLPIPKSHAESATFVFGDKIIIAGGQVAGRGPTGDVEQYDPNTNMWTQVKSLPIPSQGGAVRQLDDHIIVALGAKQTNQPITDVWMGKIRG